MRHALTSVTSVNWRNFLKNVPEMFLNRISTGIQIQDVDANAFSNCLTISSDSLVVTLLDVWGPRVLFFTTLMETSYSCPGPRPDWTNLFWDDGRVLKTFPFSSFYEEKHQMHKWMSNVPLRKSCQGLRLTSSYEQVTVKQGKNRGVNKSTIMFWLTVHIKHYL